MITVATVVSASNLDGLERVMDLAAELGVDNVSVNPVHDTSSSLFGPRGEGGDGVSARLRDIKARRGILDSSDAYLGLMDAFFASKPLPMPCLAPYFSLYADCYGRVMPCGGLYYQARSIPGLDGMELRHAWRHPLFQAERDRLRACRACFFSCMAELNLAYVAPR